MRLRKGNEDVLNNWEEINKKPLRVKDVKKSFKNELEKETEKCKTLKITWATAGVQKPTVNLQLLVILDYPAFYKVREKSWGFHCPLIIIFFSVRGAEKLLLAKW